LLIALCSLLVVISPSINSPLSVSIIPRRFVLGSKISNAGSSLARKDFLKALISKEVSLIFIFGFTFSVVVAVVVASVVVASVVVASVVVASVVAA